MIFEQSFSILLFKGEMDVKDEIISEDKEKQNEYIQEDEKNFLEYRVMEEVIKRGLTIATAAWCTGGMVEGRVINYPGG